MLLIAIGNYYRGEPHTYRSARTLTAARAWLRAQGYCEREPRYGLRAYFEHEWDMQWARVVAAPDVEDKANA